MNSGIDVRSRQDPLRKHYKETPEDARITDRAITTGGTETDPFHGKVVPGTEDYGVVWPFGIHRAIGGYHDLPNPGDMLSAALATCLDSTIRIIAGTLGRVPDVALGGSGSRCRCPWVLAGRP